MGKYIRPVIKREIKYGSYIYEDYDEITDIISNVDLIMNAITGLEHNWKNYESDESIELSLSVFEMIEKTDEEIINALKNEGYVGEDDGEFDEDDIRDFEKAIAFVRMLHKNIKDTNMDYIRLEFFN